VPGFYVHNCWKAAIERELKLYNQVSVIDLETAPVYLQYSILMSAVKWFDRNVRTLNELNKVFCQNGKKTMRDIAYEQVLLRHQRRMLRILDEYSSENTAAWTERDFLAIQTSLAGLY